MKILDIIRGIIATIGTIVGYFLGGFDAMLITLLIFIVIDYVTGIMDGVIQKNLSSEVGFKGIFKKVLILLMVGIATRLDITLGIEGLRYLVISFYIANEGISILENASILGLPVPNKIQEVLEQLKSEKEGE